MGRVLISAALVFTASVVAFGQVNSQPQAGGNAGGQAASATARQPEIKVGAPAPDIKVEQLLQAPTGATTDLKSLRGKVTVLEFWATWCAPCVKAFKHMNEVAESVKGKPVQFISITDEADAPLIREFLRDQPVSGWVGLDTDGSVFKAYRVGTRPHTVVIDAEGKIRAITYSTMLTAAALEDVLAGRPISLPPKPLRADGSTEEVTQTGGELFRAIIEPSPGSGRLYGQVAGPLGRIESDGITLGACIVTAYRMPSTRVVQSPPLRDMYRVRVQVPKDRAELVYLVFQQALEVTFGLKVHREMREAEVFVLRVATDKATRLRPSQATKSSYAMMAGRFVGEKQTIKQFADVLEHIVGLPVVDETGLTAEYDWDLPYNKAGNRVVLEALRDQLGLEALKEKRRVEFLVIDSFEQPGKISSAGER